MNTVPTLRSSLILVLFILHLSGIGMAGRFELWAKDTSPTAVTLTDATAGNQYIPSASMERATFSVPGRFFPDYARRFIRSGSLRTAMNIFLSRQINLHQPLKAVKFTPSIFTADF
jgi:hypothetical protein